MKSALIWANKLFKVKKFNNEEIGETRLARVLTTVDLTLLGTGSTLGVGIYVLAGQVARESAGPAVVISFLIAAIASAFAGFCYAEFGARVPKSGSAYVYSYCTVGEFVAYLIGWNLMLEYIIGTASVTKGVSTYLDELIGNYISDFFKSILPMNSQYLGDYPDFLAFGIVTIFSVCLAVGLKNSTTVNNVFTCINLSIVVFVIIAGCINAKIENWSIPQDQVPPGAGKGGFAPFGISGIIKGAATCFYGFIGFDCIATTGEEAKTPKKSIPIAIVVSLLIIFFMYFGVSAVLTLMWPYYDQNVNAPLASIFQEIGWVAAKWIVSVGALFGLLPSLLGSLLPLPRIIYAMSNDGLLFRFLGKVNEKYQSPVLGTILSGLFTGFMAMIFNLSQLVDMMSIGTLLAYTIVASCVLILRYQSSEEDETPDDFDSCSFYTKLSRHVFKFSTLKSPTKFSSSLVSIAVFFYCVFVFASLIIIAHFPHEIENRNVATLMFLTLFILIAVLLLMVIAAQPKSRKKLYFKVPLVPFVPAFSIVFNLYLMLVLDSITWIRFGVWIIVGIIIYFTYGIRNSNLQAAEKSATSSDDTVAMDFTKPTELKY